MSSPSLSQSPNIVTVLYTWKETHTVVTSPSSQPPCSLRPAPPPGPRPGQASRSTGCRRAWGTRVRLSLETHRAARCRAQHGETGPSTGTSTGTRGVACLCTQEIGPRALPRLGPVRGSKGTCGAHHSVVRFVICCIAAMGSSVIAWALEAAESAHSAGPKGRASASY